MVFWPLPCPYSPAHSPCPHRRQVLICPSRLDLAPITVPSLAWQCQPCCQLFTTADVLAKHLFILHDVRFFFGCGYCTWPHNNTATQLEVHLRFCKWRKVT